MTISRAHDIQDFELLASDDQAVLEQLIGDRDIPAPPDDDETNSRSSAATIKPNSATRPRGRAKKSRPRRLCNLNSTYFFLQERPGLLHHYFADA